MNLSLRQLSKHYGATRALDGIDLEINTDQYVVLLGPSGSGKTTLLSIIGGFIPPSSGQVLLGGKDITAQAPAQRPTATVFQDYALFPHMSVGRNVGFGLAMRGVSRIERRRRVAETLSVVGLEGYERRRIHELSGGQRQRVALARAIIVEPQVLLLDEPLGALDLNLRRQMQSELKHLQRRLGRTFIHVTHDQDEALALADLLIVMNQGKLEDSGRGERVYRRPRTGFSATFMGDSNLIPGRVINDTAQTTTVKTGLGELRVVNIDNDNCALSGGEVLLMIRPEQLLIDTPPDTDDTIFLGAGRLGETVFHGAHQRCHVMMDTSADLELQINTPPGRSLTAGQAVRLFVRRSDVVLLTR